MSNSSTGLPPDVPVPESTLLVLGPMYAGCLMAFLLFGISIMQLYHYSMTFTRDAPAIRLTVYGIFLLDIFQSFTIAVLGWDALVGGWGRPLALLDLNWTFAAVPAVTGIVAAWVQGFYAWRIYMIGQWKLLPAFIVAIALMQCAGALSIAAAIPTISDVTQLHQFYRRTIVWLGGAVAADVIIAVAMLYLLFAARRSKFAHTQRVINRLIRMTVETGVVTATCALMELIMFQVLPNTNLHIFFASMLAKIYSNALMTSLNSRRSPSGSRPSDLEGSAGSSAAQYSGASASIPRRAGVSTFGSFAGGGTATTVSAGTATVVHISTATDREGDYGSAYEVDVKAQGDEHDVQDVYAMSRIGPGPGGAGGKAQGY